MGVAEIGGLDQGSGCQLGVAAPDKPLGAWPQLLVTNLPLEALTPATKISEHEAGAKGQYVPATDRPDGAYAGDST